MRAMRRKYLEGDICSVVTATDGSYVSFCGMWFDEDNHEAYLEL